MICKWCGEKLEGTATRCGRCGRETPAMSDCGGFYKLGGAEPAQASAKRVTSAVSGPAQQEGSSARHSKSKNNKRNRMDRQVLYCGLGAALVLILVLFVMVISLNAKANRLAGEIVQLQIAVSQLKQNQPEEQQNQPLQESQTPDNQEPAETEAPETEAPETEPAEQLQMPDQVDVNLVITRTEEDISMMGDVNAGKEGGSNSLRCERKSNAGIDEYKTTIRMPDHETEVEILMRKSMDENEVIRVEVHHGFDQIYGDMEQCYPVWKYRTGEDEEWQNLPEAGFAMLVSENGFVLEASLEDYLKLGRLGYVELSLFAEIPFAGGETVRLSVAGLPVVMQVN